MVLGIPQGDRGDPVQGWSQPLHLYFMPSSASCPFRIALTSFFDRPCRPSYAVAAEGETSEPASPLTGPTPRVDSPTRFSASFFRLVNDF
ncbi:hypothetical protein BHE74_00037309 [Ensete ventricosum]|uniref:Uncharacterized protein n=1 Tax=Ensete ventricosum TaxID=4639 RepID=A0A444D5P0_ENSVE|nr:hypothetical protein GW17_00044132 [Ensete ventricosum]RWW56016.1 hypothetical protein BHE74_00037309 [Ensete ventricosum]RZR72770.1 hypothetical protein BHM03_00016926 [Ensete ventricosum]